MGRRKTGASWQDAKAGKLLKDLVDKKSVTQIAQEEGGTPRAILYRMSRPAFQEILTKFTADLAEVSQEWIEELHQSDDPLDRRLAAQLKVQMLKIFTPRLNYSDTRNLNINLEERSVKLQQGWDNLSLDERTELKKTLLKMEEQK